MTVSIERWTNRAALMAGGMTEHQVDASCRSGELHRLRPGRYVPATAWTDKSAVDRHLLRAEEVGAAVADRAVISHHSAAVLHGMDLPPMDLPRVHVTWPGSNGRRATTNVHPHRGRLMDDDIVHLDGIAVTSATRTLFDLACTSPPAVSLSAADSALRNRQVTRPGCVALLTRTSKVPGHSRAVRVLEFADGRAESVGESITRLRLAQLGIPDPALQVVLVGTSYPTAIRVDLEIVGHRTVVEFDGRVKYGRFLRPAQTAADAVFEEKRREDAIRATGRECVRIVWDELAAERFRQVLLPRFQAAFARAGFPDWRPGPGRFLAA